MAHRIERVNSLIRQELSEMLQREVKDPRLGNFIMVTAVATTPDLKYSKVSVSSINHDTDRKGILQTLTSASGFFHKELIKRLSMRHVPELTFVWDDSIERADRLMQTIDKITSERENTEAGSST